MCVKSGNATVTDRRTKGKRVKAMKYNLGVDDSEDTSSSDTESRDIRTMMCTYLKGAYSKTICVFKQPKDENAL